MNYKAIIFDFDGVLFDSERIHLQACNDVFHDLGFSIPEQEYFQHYVGVSDNEMFDLILNKRNIAYTEAECLMLRQNKITAYQNIINKSESLDGVGNVKHFIESYSVFTDQFAICSGSTREEIEATLNKLESGHLRKHFKHIITINDIRAGKPSPEGYLLAANRLNMQPKHCLAIEDTPIGVAAAKSAGMNVAAITTTHAKSAFKFADFIADNYADIDQWLRNQMS